MNGSSQELLLSVQEATDVERNQLVIEIESLIENSEHDFPAVASILHYLCAALIARREANLANLVDMWGQQHLEHLDDE